MTLRPFRAAFKSILACSLVGLISGCMPPTKSVLSLAPGQEPPAVITLTEPTTYYLFSSADEKKPIYRIDLNKRETVGFVKTGDRLEAVARGIRISLPDLIDGVTYSWRVPEK